MNDRISCAESDKLRPSLHPWSSCTNYVGGEILDDRLPPHTRCEWCDDDEVVRLIDVLDSEGCRHEVPAGVKAERRMESELGADTAGAAWGGNL